MISQKKNSKTLIKWKQISSIKKKSNQKAKFSILNLSSPNNSTTKTLLGCLLSSMIFSMTKILTFSEPF